MSAVSAPWRDPSFPTAPWGRVLVTLCVNEYRNRYRAQSLGVVWSIANPLLQMGVLSIVFAHLLGDKVQHVGAFMLIGLIVWHWVQSSLTGATNVFLTYSELVRRAPLQRRLLPLAVILSYGITFLIESAIVVVYALVSPSSFALTPALLLVPVLLGLLCATMAGISFATASLNVIYRDAAFAVTTGLTLLYWLTPVVYPLSTVPERYRAILRVNPLGGIIEALRGAIIDGTAPDAIGWAYIVAPVALVLAFGLLVFRRFETTVLDHI